MAAETPDLSNGSSNNEVKSLKDEVAELVEKHASSRDSKPPFSVGETIIIAVILEELTTFSSADVLKAVLRHISYWNAHFIERYFDRDINGESAEDYDTEEDCIVPGFFEAFSKYALPLRMPRQNLPYQRHKRTRCTVSSSAARFYLRGRLEPSRRGTFPFMRLPAELRNMIYEMSLRFPTPGLCITRLGKKKRLDSIRGLDDDDLDCGLVDGVELFDSLPNPAEMKGDPLQYRVSKHDLSLLKVCKQIYSEAMPIFYGLNTFNLSRSEDFYYSLIKRRPQLEIDSLKRINFTFIRPYRSDGSEYRHWTVICQTLASLKLDVLVLGLSDRHFLRMPGKPRESYFSRATQFTKIEQISGFSDLAVAANRAKKFLLYQLGDCRAIKKYFDEEILKLTKGVGAPEVKSKKRGKKQFKSAEMVVEDEEPVKKAKKRRNVKKIGLLQRPS